MQATCPAQPKLLNLSIQREQKKNVSVEFTVMQYYYYYYYYYYS